MRCGVPRCRAREGGARSPAHNPGGGGCKALRSPCTLAQLQSEETLFPPGSAGVCSVPPSEGQGRPMQRGDRGPPPPALPPPACPGPGNQRWGARWHLRRVPLCPQERGLASGLAHTRVTAVRPAHAADENQTVVPGHARRVGWGVSGPCNTGASGPNTLPAAGTVHSGHPAGRHPLPSQPGKASGGLPGPSVSSPPCWGAHQPCALNTAQCPGEVPVEGLGVPAPCPPPHGPAR